MFRNIPAKEIKFNQMKYKFNSFFVSYERFVANTELGHTRGVTKYSRKAQSYKNYLIRIFILIEEINHIILKEPLSLDTYLLVENIKHIYGYDEFNRLENRFPNSAINYYLSFVSQFLIENETTIDNLIDNSIGNNLANTNTSLLFIEENIDGPRKKLESIMINNIKKYRRNILEVKKAKVSAQFLCEYNNKHKTFINEFDNNQYIEAHHLIPMATQDLFEYNIDFADNIICLCPNCHRRIHYGVRSDRSEMIQNFYNMRKEKIESFNIEIEYNSLKLFYNVF